jgi:hypothetical protein
MGEFCAGCHLVRNDVALTFVQFVLLQIIIWLRVGRLAWFVDAWLERS